MFRLSPFAPFRTAFVVALPHGIAAGVHLPGNGDPVAEDVLVRLHPEEATFARGLGGFRQPEFVGGRLAFAELLSELGADEAAVLSNLHGAPTLPSGVVGSITHKRDLVIAMVARGTPGLGPALGIDLEETDRVRPGVAERVLRPEELAAVESLAEDRRWTDTVVRFAVKEAVYKALHPFLQRYIGFGEVAVWPNPDGIDRVEARLQPGEGPFRFDARHYWVDTRVFATVRVRPEPPPEGSRR